MAAQIKTSMKIIFIVTLLFLFSCKNQADADVVAGHQYTLTRVFPKQSFNKPVAMLQVPGDDKSWYVVEQAGRVLRLSQVGQRINRQVFLDITDRVDAGPNEAGLLGLAFHPDYANNGQLFVSYTRSGSPLVSVISRFVRAPANESVPIHSEKVLLTLDQPYANHNGGSIGFDANGYLMIGFGDGGSGGDPQGNGQNVKTWLGALLRIDVDKGEPYSIPKDNPFASSGQGRAEIYAWGLRNPWRFSFDRKTSELWLADVGQSKWEEVDIISSGGNYGWNVREGKHCYSRTPCNLPQLIDPVAEYSHELGCSITGGYVYRGKRHSELHGAYIFGDFCSGLIWGLFSTEKATFDPKLLVKSGLNISSFAEDNLGELFVIDYSKGVIYLLDEITNKR